MIDIEFKGILPRTGDYLTGLFIVDEKEIKIGISDTLLSIWKIPKNDTTVALFLKQFGGLKILLMLGENSLADYTFVSYHFQTKESDVERTMTLGEVEDYLKEQILKLDESKSTKCPKCNSTNINKLGPYARRKKEGESAYRGHSNIYHNCWDCEHKWEV
jgi:hypothetical protein